MTEGEQVALYWPDCEMFQWIGTDAIGLFIPGYHDDAVQTMTSANFIKYHPEAEFVLYEINAKK